MVFFNWIKGKRRKRKRALQTPIGEHYNLLEIYSRVNARYFENQIDLPISWFGDKQRKPRRKIVLGSYHFKKKWIRIHRVLDQPHIPDHFISFIVYHEILHHLLPPIEGKRRKIHHKEFKQREQLFEEYSLAKSYLKEFDWRK